MRHPHFAVPQNHSVPHYLAVVVRHNLIVGWVDVVSPSSILEGFHMVQTRNLS
jgi:hypothetical protein